MILYFPMQYLIAVSIFCPVAVQGGASSTTALPGSAEEGPFNKMLHRM